MKAFAAALLLLCAATSALADGGRVRLHEQAGPFIVTLFTTPDPLRPGEADFSVAVERSGQEGLDQDADVTFTLTPAEGQGRPIVLHASHAQATSRFLQAANFTLPHSGVWNIAIHLREGTDQGSCHGQIDVLAPNLITDEVAWEIAAVPIVVLLFLLHQWRKRSILRRRQLTGAAQQNVAG